MSATINPLIQSLPDDVEALKIIIAAQQQTLLEKDKIIAKKEHAILQKESSIAIKEQRITTLEEYIRLQKLKRFAASSEKSVLQQEMFNEAKLSVAAEDILSEQEQPGSDTKAPSSTTPKKKGRTQATTTGTATSTH